MTTITKGIRILDYDIILQLRNTDSNCIVYKAEDPKTKKKEHAETSLQAIAS